MSDDTPVVTKLKHVVFEDGTEVDTVVEGNQLPPHLHDFAEKEVLANVALADAIEDVVSDTEEGLKAYPAASLEWTDESDGRGTRV